MIQLDSVTVGDNMYLAGLQSEPTVDVTQKRTIDGVAHHLVSPRTGGRKLTLGSQRDSAIQGIWCMSTIDAIKVVEALGQAVTLNYHSTLYTVIITGTNDMAPLHINEAEGPNKQFTGKIHLIEV